MYVHRGNSVIAFSAAGGAKALAKSPVKTVDEPLAPVDPNQLKQNLAGEVEKIVSAGHLRPGFGVNGWFSEACRFSVGDELTDYWHYPFDMVLALTRAYPHLPDNLFTNKMTFTAYPFERPAAFEPSGLTVWNRDIPIFVPESKKFLIYNIYR